MSQELEQAINSLCLTGHYSTLYRLIGKVPGSKAILISDKTAEGKRQELLKLLKQQKPSRWSD